MTRYLTAEELLTLVAAALRERVLPDCGSAARGQVWAAIGILENLATRVEQRTAAEPEIDPRSLLAELETAEGWERVADAVRRTEDYERGLRRPTYFGEIFRREGDS